MTAPADTNNPAKAAGRYNPRTLIIPYANATRTSERSIHQTEPRDLGAVPSELTICSQRQKLRNETAAPTRNPPPTKTPFKIAPVSAPPVPSSRINVLVRC